MENQRMSRVRRMLAATRAAVLILALALCLCALATVAFAESAVPTGGVESISFADGVGVAYDSAAKYWGKTYDGTSEISPEDVILTVAGQTEEKQPVVISAGFIAANTSDPQSGAGVARLRIVYEWDGVEREYTAPARIGKKLLSWKELVLETRFTYDPARTSYIYTPSADELSSVTVASLVGVLEGDAEKLSLGAVESVTVSDAEVTAALSKKETLRLYTSCVLSGEAAPNYMLEGIEVRVAVDPCRITEVLWGIDGNTAEGALEFSYGDADAYLITAVGKIGESDFRELIVKVKGADVTLAQADESVYGAVREEPYVLYAESATPDFFVLDGTFETPVTFRRAECVISVSDAVFEQDAEHNLPFYYLPIQNPDGNVPARVFVRIGYKFTQDGVTFVDAISEPGEYTVHFFLHPDDEASYSLRVVEAGEGADGVIRATLLPFRLTVGLEAGGADVILYNEGGSLAGIGATVSLAEDISAELLRRFSVYRGLTLRLTGAEKGDRFRMILPIHSDLLSDANTNALTAEDLYLLDGKALKPLKDVYTVTLDEKGTHYVVSGVSAEGELSLTLLIAPSYRVSFWATAPGIALIVFLVLLFVMALILLGLFLIRLEKRGVNPLLRIDTEGETPRVTPGEAPERLGSADECIEEGLDALAGELTHTVEPEAPVEETADATEAIAETLGAVLTEAALGHRDDPEERAIEEVEHLTEAMAEEKAKDLLATEAPETTEADADAESLEGAVAEALNDAVESVRDDGSDVAETMAQAELLPRLRETVDAIVVEALAATVQLPEGLHEIGSDATGDPDDVSAQVERSVSEALRAIGGVSPNEGVDAEAIADAVANAVKKFAPAEWEADAVRELQDSLIATLQTRLLK